MFWWIVTTFKGQPVILGPYTSEEEASQVGFEKLGGNFESYELPTRDKSKATSMIKARILNKTSDLETALRKAKHQIPKEKEI